jgi:hypothetical protein
VGYGITVDAIGFAYLTGYTGSSDFPTINAHDNTFNGGYIDAFVLKLSINGSSLIYSTYIGGTSAEIGIGIMMDAFGYTYLTGLTESSDFPTIHAFDDSFNNGTDIMSRMDVFALKIYIDTDSDGLPDPWELLMGLNAMDSTDASLDKDNDGLPNLWEFQMGLNATDPRDAAQDSDGDGLPNFWEFQMGLNARNPTDASIDSDYDNLTNLDEYHRGTNPNLNDTDRDGWNDEIDWFPINPWLNWILLIGLLVCMSFLGYFIGQALKPYIKKFKDRQDEKKLVDHIMAIRLEEERQTEFKKNFETEENHQANDAQNPQKTEDN